MRSWLIRKIINKSGFVNRIIEYSLTLDPIDRNHVLDPFIERLGNIQEIQNHAIYARRIEINNKIAQLFENTVQEGPFSGLILSPSNIWGTSDKASMILGLYELEVQEVIDEILKNQPDRNVLLDIGAGDGFYAIGFATKVRNYIVHAWEIEASQQSQISQLSQINNVALHLHGKASIDFFKELSPEYKSRKVLIICDIESEEYQIINRESLGYFDDAIWIIETHLFENSHFALRDELISLAKDMGFSVRTLHTGSRDVSKYLKVLKLDDVDRWLICPEGRGILSGNLVVLAKSTITHNI